MNAGRDPRRLLAPVLALALALPMGACDDDPTEPARLDQSLVVGTYDPATLTFDVAGPTFGEYDLLEGLRTEQEPPRLVLATNRTAQLAFLNPVTGQFEVANATYSMTEVGVLIQFETAAAPARLLLPQTLELVYDAESETLVFLEEVQATRQRLVELVPELADEPLSDPVGGTLRAVFTQR